MPSKSPMAVVDVCPTVTIKTTRAGPATALAVVGEMSVGAQPQQNEPRRVPQAFLADNITIDKLSGHPHTLPDH